MSKANKKTRMSKLDNKEGTQEFKGNLSGALKNEEVDMDFVND